MDSTLLAGFIGASGAVIGVLAGEFVKDLRDQAQRRKETKNLIKAIECEAHTLWTQYLQSYGNDLLQHESGTPFYLLFPCEQQYFTVYEANADQIGAMPAPLATAIVGFYIKAKGMLDTIQLNNEFYRAAAEFALHQTDSHIERSARAGQPLSFTKVHEVETTARDFKARMLGMPEYSDALLTTHRQLEAAYDDMCDQLQRIISSNH